LPRQAFLLGVLLDVIDSSKDVVTGVQEHLVDAVRPDGVIGRDEAGLAECIGCGNGKIIPDQFRSVAMRADHDVCMIRADGARPERISTILSGASYRIPDHRTMLLLEPNDFMVEAALRVAVELSQLIAMGLDVFTPLMDVSQVAEFILPRFDRSASARVVA
jgi:hypothetical protein